MEVTGGEVLLLLAGRKVRATSEVPLEAGQRLRLEVIGRVAGARGDEILLRVVPPGRDAAGLQAWLQEVVREMRLALPAARMAELAATAQAWGLSRAEIPALAWLAARGLPVTPQSISLLIRAASWPWPQPDIASEIQALRERAGRLPRGADVVGALDGILARLTWAGGPQEELAATLKNLPQVLGLDYEARVAALLSGGRPPASTGTPQVLEDNLKGWLFNLTRLAGNIGFEGTEGTEVAHHFLARLTHLQLLGQAGQGLAFMGLVWLAGSQTPYLLKIWQRSQQEDEGKTGSGSTCSSGFTVTFLVEPPRLGVVSGRLSLIGETLSCRLVVQKEATQRLINSRLPELVKALEALFPRVTVYPCAREAGVVREILIKEFACFPPTAGIDVRV